MDGKTYYGLLVGVMQARYLHDAAMTTAVLREELEVDLPEPEFEAQVEAAFKLMSTVVSQDMDVAKLERYLGAQVSKKTPMSPTQAQADAFIKFWKSKRSKIQKEMVSRSSWKPQLMGVSWRVDVKTKSRHIEELNEATAIVELKVGEAGCQPKGADVIRFELDGAKLQETLRSLDEIEAQIKALS